MPRRGRSLEWKDLLTTGDPLFKRQLSIACTTLENSVTYTVPQNERWILLGGYMKCCTLASGNLTISCLVYDDLNNLIDRIGVLSTTSGGHMALLNSFSNQGLSSGAGFPHVMYEGQKITLIWAAGAEKSGSGAYYLNILKFKVGIE